MNFIPTEHDIRVARLLDKELGPIRFIEVIHHEENRMTEQATEMEQDYDGGPEGGAAFGGATYPEYPYSLADHVYTWSPKLPDGSMLVIRSQSADGLVKAVKEMGPLAGQLRAAWQDVVGQPQAAPQAMPQGGPFGQPTPPPFGPNVSVPQAPGYQGPPAQAAPAWGGGQPQAGFGGGAQQGNRQGPKPRPEWPVVYKINVPYQGKEAFKTFREQHKDALKGKVAWAGGGDYWIHGDVVSGFGQYNPMAA